MNKEKSKKKETSVIKELRLIRDNINEEIKDMTPQEYLEYLKKQKTFHPKSCWQTTKK